MTYKITTDFAGTESLATTKTRLESILDFWLGSGSTSSVSTWGDIRTLLNTVAPAAITIADGELASSFRTKLNTLNSTDDVVSNLLFNADEPGVWYDPSDLDTLFQDTAGTTPVTSPGQTVGLMLDKSGNDFHATQPTAAARPTYGIVPETGRRNLLTRTEEFDNAVWLKAAVDVSSNVTVAPDGTLTAESLISNTTNGVHSVRQIVTGATNVTRTFSAYVKQGSGTYRVSLAFGSSSSGTPNIDASNRGRVVFDLSSQSVIETVVAGNLSILSSSLTSVGSGWFRISATLVFDTTGANTLMASAIVSAPIGQNPVFPWSGDGTSGHFIWGAQLEVGSTATDYQKVTTQFDVTEAGVPSLGYLSFDGVDDFMVTPTITPGTDKVQVFAGVRKLSDAFGFIAEFGPNMTNSNGGFGLFPAFDATGWGFGTRGTVFSQAVVSTGYAAPVTSVLSGLGDISNDAVTLRADGTQVAQSTADQGTSNYLSYPMYIGRRGGTSLPFNGHIYSLITRFGPNLAGTSIAATETYTAFKTGVTL